MKNRSHNPFSPLCRFGPGGDFTSDWPGSEDYSTNISGNRLLRALKLLSEIITTAAGGEFNAAQKKGNLKYAHENRENDKSANAASDADPKIYKLVPGQSVLFPDDSRIGKRTANKPKYRVRTYQRTAKKRHGHSKSRQGSLFDVDHKSAKTA